MCKPKKSSVQINETD